MISRAVLQKVNISLAEKITRLLIKSGWDAGHQTSYPVCEVFVKAEEPITQSLHEILEHHVTRDENDIAIGLKDELVLKRMLPKNLAASSSDEIGRAEEGEEVERQAEIPEDLFDVVVGHDEVKELFFMSLRAEKPVHILLVGPPATAKSVFLTELERLRGSRTTLGGTSSKAGIVDFIIEHRPRYLLIDELEKMDKKDYSALLSLMDPGKVNRLKKGMTDEIEVKTWVFAAVNKDDNLPTELKSRFYTRYLSEYSEQEFKKVVGAVLVKREHVDEDIAANIADEVVAYSKDVRDAVKIARLYCSKDQHMTIDELVKLAFGYRRKQE
jgi:Holliday junction DNA helicase RuvB